MTETETMGERLSALVDGELSGAEYDHAVDAIHLSPELNQRWMRYHIAADALKNSLPHALLKPDFSTRVMHAIDAEPTILAPRNFSFHVRPVTKQLAGLAVAASVTAIAVLGVQTWRLQAEAEPAAAVAQIAPPAANVIHPVAAVAADNTPLPAHVQSQINQYLLNHNQNALAAQRMLPYARIVGYATGDAAE
jgi:sigma-E factor negative regulatory protein RseA